jgi:uncharacterized membrane protein YhaH (DUF805 family)
MNMIEAVKACFSKYVTFSGRARRAEYWWFVLFTVLGSFVFGFVDGLMFGTSMETTGLFGAVFSLGTLLPSISVGVRRLHDLDRSGWWLLLMLLPIIGWIVLIVWNATKGTQGDNRFGPDPLRGDRADVFA